MPIGSGNSSNKIGKINIGCQSSSFPVKTSWTGICKGNGRINTNNNINTQVKYTHLVRLENGSIGAIASREEVSINKKLRNNSILVA